MFTELFQKAEIYGCRGGVLYSQGSSSEPHSTDSSLASLGSLMGGPDVDGSHIGVSLQGGELLNAGIVGFN